ncbi:MAG: hypothetical protein KGP28_02815 [Bdellovibrionales bacterium]|nr:hypothetical protein [Bdellovibrionales bacterium]
MIRQQLKWISIAVLFFALNAGARPVALIYQGDGSCEDGCSEASAEVATQAGFEPRFVGPEALNADSSEADVAALYRNARVWIQPGGVAVTAFYSMTPELRNSIREFVGRGGGYVGFCAGAFMATLRIGSSRYAGLGILPGFTAPYGLNPIKPSLGYSLPFVSWGGTRRQIFFEGGPYFYGFESQAETVARYDTGYAAAVRAFFGKGRVFVSGPHPEAPLFWTQEDGIMDPDGIEQDLAVQMVRWASGITRTQ